MFTMFTEYSHISDATSDKLKHQLSYVISVFDLDQRSFKTRKDLCDFITEVQPACEGNDSTLINKLLSNIELVSDLVQESVDTLVKTHRENNVFYTLSLIMSM